MPLDDPAMAADEDSPDVAHNNTRERVALLLKIGLGRLEIARLLGISKSTVSYHARRLGEPMHEKATRRYDWAEVQRYYDEGHSISECQLRFGFARETWNAARRRGAVRSRPQALPIDELLVAGRQRSRSAREVPACSGSGLKENRCEDCGLIAWRGQPLAMALHHVNGDGRRQHAREPPAPVPELPQPDGELRWPKLAARPHRSREIRSRRPPAAPSEAPSSP